MKSIETLKNICTNCERIRGQFKIGCPFRSLSNEYCEEYDIIKKDLEVLEILKKYISETSCLVLTEEEYYKIKEWKNE